MKKGNIGVTTENIFPVIKKFLYSDHEIFLRELVSNAVDATRKIQALASFGEFKGELGQLDVRVTVDKEAGTLTVSDSGIGMTAEDVDKYINQIAFSGAEEFLNKYKDTAATIIGHFGLGFYSAFMVSKKVVIETLSYKEGAEPVRWECDGSPEYSMGKGSRTTRGTDIILYIDDESKEFLEQQRIDLLLRKYCRFLPVPVISGKEMEYKDGKWVASDRDLVVNSTEPQWMKKPAELTDEDYLNFYHELYPGEEDPLFWIHLNVDYPFNLTGILYFPKIKNNIDVNRNRIQLYSNQVYVTDSVEGVVPEFMMLMRGIIDSPDIPLNVSRSYLQADTAVKKISTYITKKVAQRLDELFKADRTEFEKKWDDIRIFIVYGMLTDEKFADAALKFYLLTDTEGRHYTIDEYKEVYGANQTDRDGKTVFLYTTDPAAQHAYIKAAAERGYNILVLDGQLDNHLVSFIEHKFQDIQMARVDAGVVDQLIRKEDSNNAGLNDTEAFILSNIFNKLAEARAKGRFTTEFYKGSTDGEPVTVVQNEQMRRMKEMMQMQGGMSMFGDLPDSYTLSVNTEAPVIRHILDERNGSVGSMVQDFLTLSKANNERIEALRKGDDAKKEDNQTEIHRLEDEINTRRTAVEGDLLKLGDLAAVCTQTLDLALLAAGLLRGNALTQFVEEATAEIRRHLSK